MTDVIPLEYPQYQRLGSVDPFRAKLKYVQEWADLVIYNSADTKARAEAQMAAWGKIPASIVAHLGTVPPQPDPSELPHGLPPTEPYVVTFPLYTSDAADDPPYVHRGARRVL